MPIQRFPPQPGRYFFTVATRDRRPILTSEIERLRTAFRTTRRRYPFTVDAIVILPDHLHTIWSVPEADPDFARRWTVLKRLFSSGLPGNPVSDLQRRRREKGIWQRRFWEHAIRDDDDWHGHMDYIHYNPVKHGLCSRPAEWPYSSFRRWVERGWYDESWGSVAPTGVAAVGERAGIEGSP